MASTSKKFALVVDNEVAFVLTPPENMPAYEMMVAVFSSDPKVVEIPLEDENRDVIGGDWLYIDGKFVNKFAYNPNVPPPNTP